MEVPFALSIHKFVNSVGADAGFAAFIGIALLAVLYFGQARETAALRDRLEEAQDRIGGLEARIAQLLHLQSSRQTAAQPAPVPPPVTPAPAGVRAMGSAVASVRRVPTATPAGAAAGAPGPRVAAPVGTGAPALASATKLIPDALPAAAAAAGVTEDTMLVPAAGNGRGQATAASVPPPPVRIRTGGAAAPGEPAEGAATATAVPRRPISPIQPGNGSRGGRARNEQRFEQFEPDSGGRFSGRAIPIGIALIAVIAIAIGAFVITRSGNSSPTSGTVAHNSTTPTTGGSGAGKGKTTKKKVTTIAPATITVAVLNGTDVSGLAGDVGKDLGHKGYKQGSITNASTQTQTHTVVYYMTGFEAAAKQVAAALELGKSVVQPATQTAIQACATSPAGTTSSCSGDVIVSVGADRSSLATSSGSSSAG